MCVCPELLTPGAADSRLAGQVENSSNFVTGERLSIQIGDIALDEAVTR
ncbi:hypothetical protein BJ963_000140 [Leifsonia soli]|uniref:Uncharacterized protein n=1 Tax=Leifsonia soli TaxID=582665 RepID=A0A852SV29_9MICO|nr:hypothetical protein [Leifsonia soli]